MFAAFALAVAAQPRPARPGAAALPPVVETPPVKPEERSAVEGAVLNAQSGEPLRKATLTLRRSDGRQGGPGAVYSTTTDASGRFLIPDIEPGKYRLTAERSGFVNQRYGATRPGGNGTEIVLDKAQKLRDINLRMVPHGVVTGRVLDADGDPLVGSSVQVLRRTYIRGRKQLMPVENAETNDLGEYRVYGLSPGRYYLSAVHRRGGFRGTPVQGGEQEAYTPTYYPGGSSPDMAAPVDIAPGAQMQGMDFRLQKTRTVRVSGRVVGASTRGANVALIPRAQAMNFAARNMSRPYNQQGDFIFNNEVPGSYILTATVMESGKASTARMQLDVGNSAIEGLALQLAPAAQLNGRVRVEGTGDGKGVRVNLMPRITGMNFGPGAQGGQAKEDGTFVLANIQPELYDVRVSGVPDGGYVKSIKLGNADIMDSGLDFTSGVIPAEVTVTVSMTAAAVDGSVQNDKQEPAANATVVLVPDGARRESDRYYVTATTDSAGKFTLKNITPGEYRIYAFDFVEGSSYMDPDWLQPFESKGERVTARESGRESMQLKLVVNQ
jgi:protocatechuate 3,4-dioxygenase beta subunit